MGLRGMDLHSAAMLNDEAAVRSILEQQTSGGKLMRLLTLRGSLVNERDQGGATPLHHAAMGGAGSAATALLEHGADVNARDNEGATALHLAAWANSAEMCGLLCLRGANRSLRDKEGRRPYDIAVAKDFKTLLATLEPAEGAGPADAIARSNSVPQRPDSAQQQAASAARLSQPRPRAATATPASRVPVPKQPPTTTKPAPATKAPDAKPRGTTAKPPPGKQATDKKSTASRPVSANPKSTTTNPAASRGANAVAAARAAAKTGKR